MLFCTKQVTGFILRIFFKNEIIFFTVLLYSFFQKSIVWIKINLRSSPKTKVAESCVARFGTSVRGRGGCIQHWEDIKFTPSITPPPSTALSVYCFLKFYCWLTLHTRVGLKEYFRQNFVKIRFSRTSFIAAFNFCGNQKLIFTKFCLIEMRKRKQLYFTITSMQRMSDCSQIGKNNSEILQNTNPTLWVHSFPSSNCQNSTVWAFSSS